MTGRPRRLRRGARTALLSGAVIALLVILYGWLLEPRLLLRVEREAVPMPGLPAAWAGSTIAVTGDFEVGAPGANSAMAHRVVRRLVAERPAAVLLIGDFVRHDTDDRVAALERLEAILRPLAQSGTPAFAVLGEHDWGIDGPGAAPDSAAASELRATLRRLGVRVLDDQSAALRPFGGGPSLHLVGIGSPAAGSGRSAALEAVPTGAPRVVFMATAESFATLSAGTAPLAVAGLARAPHVRVPRGAEWPGPTDRARGAIGDGWVQGYGAPGNRLYVNRGIGFSHAPLRINRPPELTLFTLVRPGPEAHRPAR